MVSVPGMAWNGAAKAEKSKPKFHDVGSGVTPSGMPTIVAATDVYKRQP